MDRGPQFPEEAVEVVRGTPRRQVDPSNAGEHWTTDESVANYFRGREGTIIRAEVPQSSVETNPEVLAAKGVGDTQDFEGGPINEKEVTVKKGAPITIKSTTRSGPIVRSRAYRDAQATIRKAPPNDDYKPADWTAEDDKKVDEAYRTVNRRRTRTYKKGRSGQA